MQTIFLLEYQAKNDGSCTATNPLGYTDETACLSAFYSKCASAEVWRGYKQTLRHGHEVAAE